jgi:hypothetical protein
VALLEKALEGCRTALELNPKKAFAADLMARISSEEQAAVGPGGGWAGRPIGLLASWAKVLSRASLVKMCPCRHLRYDGPSGISCGSFGR